MGKYEINMFSKTFVLFKKSDFKWMFLQKIYVFKKCVLPRQISLQGNVFSLLFKNPKNILQR